MRLSTAITELSELLQRVDDTIWSEKELGSYIHRHVLSLSRRMAELDVGYFNHTIYLNSANARQVHSQDFEFTLPMWIDRITQVREALSVTAPTGASRGRAIPQLHKYDSWGWIFNGPNVLQLKGWGNAVHLEVEIAKRPPRPTKGTLPAQTSMSTSQLRIDADTSASAAIHPHETITDSYVNSIVEIVGNTARSGQIRRVTASAHFQDLAGTLYTVLTLDEPWTVQPVATTDQYELHLEIPEQHLQLVLHLAAHTAWGARGNNDQQKALAATIADQMAEFQRHVTPRSIAHPRHLRHSILPNTIGPSPTEDTQRPLWV